MKQNGVVRWPGPALLFFIFRFEYLFRARKVTRTFRQMGPVSFPFLKWSMNFSSPSLSGECVVVWLTRKEFDRAKGGGGIRAHDTARSVRGRREVPPPSLGLATKASFSVRKGNRLAYLAAKP